MAVEVTLDPASISDPYETVMAQFTGLEADTAYVFTVHRPSGNVRHCDLVSDGSGEAECEFVPSSRGEYTVEIRPATEFNGTTTALVDITVVKGA